VAKVGKEIQETTRPDPARWFSLPLPLLCTAIKAQPCGFL
jgi:hypothetical protein